jgi:2-polyprenyl-3-methyl-5-hydroxy-6-metoxy-1,4-benzoquinol methylase
MKKLDCFLQRYRYRKARPEVKGRVLDIGCYDGSFLNELPGKGHQGIDARLEAIRPGLEQVELAKYQPQQAFDTITCLATYEHFDHSNTQAFWDLAKRYVTPFGRVVMTVPHPLVDPIISAGKKLGLLDGMDEHQHRDVIHQSVLAKAHTHGFNLLKFERFQFGLNRLYVFERKETACE